MTFQEEIDQSSVFGQRLEDLVVSRGSAPLGQDGDRDKLLLAYWALALDLDKSILALLRNTFYGGAFALLRPIVEAEVRAHVVLMGSDDDVARIKNDTYTVNFRTIGAQIDTAFNLQGFFDRFLNGARGALHSFTHSGLSQLGRRFRGNDLEAHYDDDEIIEVIRTSSSAVFMVTNLVTKHFKFVDEGKRVEELFLAWGQH
ncbi:MAG TPA: hypothetical protein VOA64_08110 [Candidatus Dormibacteraeota bacterium]|nr:hypothetical protein [Candidatus Dormibacteraeota bacterium]